MGLSAALSFISSLVLCFPCIVLHALLLVFHCVCIENSVLSLIEAEIAAVASLEVVYAHCADSIYKVSNPNTAQLHWKGQKSFPLFRYTPSHHRWHKALE